VSTHRTDYVVTNDLTQSNTQAVQKAYGLRWMIETLHRELKGVTGIERCQCRRQRIQRNHIACAFLVWARLKSMAYRTGQTIYQLKHNLLRDYMISQLRSPAISMRFA
jgi:DDE family transposase